MDKTVVWQYHLHDENCFIDKYDVEFNQSHKVSSVNRV